MSGQAAIREALLMIDSVSQRFRTLLHERPDGWQRDYIDLRRSLQDAVAALAAAGRRELAGHPHMRMFEDAYSRLRHSLMLHQANWPVISLDPESKDYMASIRAIADNSAALMRIIDEMRRKVA